MSESFIVAVRIRPPSALEAAHPLHHSIICPISSDSLVFDPPVSSPEWRSPKRSSSAQHAAGGIRRVAAHVPGLPSSARHRDLRYAFDRVFDGSASQTAVYEQTARAVVSRVLDGYNATVFAYGATGCGKTHTMIGTAAQPGVMVQTLRDIFCGMAGRASVSYLLSLSYLEVYNEQLRDLLAPSSSASSLQLREERDGSMTIAGLTQHSPGSAEEVFRMLEKGNARRTQSSTDANAQSSRSHAVLQISLKMRERDTDRLTSRIRTAKLSLIDLAGSERAAVSKNRGQTLKEGANINRSLLALGNCINQLAARATANAANTAAASLSPPTKAARINSAYAKGKENKQPVGAQAATNGSSAQSASSSSASSFVPYRDSKLTRLLKDSLGGNCLTVMICNVSPSSLSAEDSHNTLKYANRAKEIRLKVERNERTQGGQQAEYEEAMREMRAELEQWKDRCSKLEKDRAEAAALSPAAAAGAQRAADEWRRRLLHRCEERQAVELAINSVKTSLVKLNATMAIQQDEVECWRRLQQQSAAAASSPPPRLTATLTADIAGHAQQRNLLLSKLQSCTASLHEHQSGLTALLAQMRAAVTDAALQQTVESAVSERLGAIAACVAKETTDSYSGMVSEYRQRLMLNNRNVVTLVRAAQALFAALPPQAATLHRDLYQQALSAVDALPVSPRLYDTLSHSERSIVQSIDRERQAGSSAPQPAPATAAAQSSPSASFVPSSSQSSLHSELHFRYASDDRDSTASAMHSDGPAAARWSERPGVPVQLATAGIGSSLTGRAFEYRLTATRGASVTNQQQQQISLTGAMPVHSSGSTELVSTVTVPASTASPPVAQSSTPTSNRASAVSPAVSGPRSERPQQMSAASPSPSSFHRLSSLSSILTNSSPAAAGPNTAAAPFSRSSSLSSHLHRLRSPSASPQHQQQSQLGADSGLLTSRVEEGDTEHMEEEDDDDEDEAELLRRHRPAAQKDSKPSPQHPQQQQQAVKSPAAASASPPQFIPAAAPPSSSSSSSPASTPSVPARAHQRNGSGAGVAKSAAAASVIASLPFALPLPKTTLQLPVPAAAALAFPFPASTPPTPAASSLFLSSPLSSPLSASSVSSARPAKKYQKTAAAYRKQTDDGDDAQDGGLHAHAPAAPLLLCSPSPARPTVRPSPSLLSPALPPMLGSLSSRLPRLTPSKGSKRPLADRDHPHYQHWYSKQRRQ